MVLDETWIPQLQKLDFHSSFSGNLCFRHMMPGLEAEHILKWEST